MAFNTAGSYGMPMRILAYDASTQTINLYDTSLFRKLGTNGFYIASWYLSKLYNPHINPDVTFIVNGKEYKAGDLFADNEASFIPKRITDYVQKAVSGNTEDDIVTPSHWDCMEGRQLSIFYDCLSRHDGKENLYVFAKGTNAPTLTRNEYCMNYTPTTESSDFSLTVRRLDENDCHIVSSKAVQVKVHHKLKNKLTKNVCICGDSLVDNGHVATEVYRLLAEDNDLNAEIAIELLQTQGAEVYRAENGKQALELFRDSPEGTFQVILMDIMMPEMNGLEAASSIRALKHPDAERIPIIAMTANTFKEDVESALNAGMTGFVSKPIDVAYLYQELNSVLSNSKRD